MDLGDFFSGVVDLGLGYFGSKTNAPPPTMGFLPNNPNVTTGFVDPTGMGGPVGTARPTLPTGAAPQLCGPSPVWKKVCGTYKWVYPKRRRRKQLITQSDAAGLAKLKGIVGQGKTMEIWIATHSGK